MNENNPKPETVSRLITVAITLGTLGILALVAIPNFVRKPARSSINIKACIQNLRQIEAAKQQWAFETGNTNADTVATWNDLKPYLGRGRQGSLESTYCPADKTKTRFHSYTIGDLKTVPKCKINPLHRLP